MRSVYQYILGDNVDVVQDAVCHSEQSEESR